MFRNLGEDYHEKTLEEAHIFPAVRKAGGPAAAYIDVLITQHERGCEITITFSRSPAKERSEPATPSLGAGLRFLRPAV